MAIPGSLQGNAYFFFSGFLDSAGFASAAGFESLDFLSDDPLPSLDGGLSDAARDLYDSLR